MEVNIDPASGFCFGVHNSINATDNELAKTDNLFSLGEIVHNREEMERLEQKGLKIINNNRLNTSNNIKVVIRAHGEPPSTYETIRKRRINLIDTTCPVVIKLQQKIHEAYLEMKEINGQVVIYGKKGHPEVNGLCGQTDNSAILIENTADIEKIDFQRPIRLFAQTTKSTELFLIIVQEIKGKLKDFSEDESFFIPTNSICKQVSGRVPSLKKFCSEHDIVIFVCGKNSSNGKYLFNICKSINPASYCISSPSEIDEGWFRGVSKTGISGATSTPVWLMEKIAKKIEQNF